jgi:hypothetical protein
VTFEPGRQEQILRVPAEQAWRARRLARAEEREDRRIERCLLPLHAPSESARVQEVERRLAYDDGRHERRVAHHDDLEHSALEPEDVRGRVAVVDGEVGSVRAIDLDVEQARPALALSATTTSRQKATHEWVFAPNGAPARVQRSTVCARASEPREPRDDSERVGRAAKHRVGRHLTRGERVHALVRAHGEGRLVRAEQGVAGLAGAPVRA